MNPKTAYNTVILTDSNLEFAYDIIACFGFSCLIMDDSESSSLS